MNADQRGVAIPWIVGETNGSFALAPLAAPTPRPGYTTHAARRVTAPGGAHRSTGWGSAARRSLGLDPHRRMG